MTLNCFNLHFLRMSKAIHFFKYLSVIFILLFVNCLFMTFHPSSYLPGLSAFGWLVSEAVYITLCASLVAQLVKWSAYKAGDPGSILGCTRFTHQFLVRYIYHRHCLPLCNLNFHSMNGIFWWTEINFNVVQFTNLFLSLAAFCMLLNKYQPTSKSRYTLLSYSKKLLCFTLHQESIFLLPKTPLLRQIEWVSFLFSWLSIVMCITFTIFIILRTTLNHMYFPHQLYLILSLQSLKYLNLSCSFH